MQNTKQLSLTPPSLPSGGGAISGLKGNIAAAGPDGAATLSLPLPVSPGRGFAPSLALSYHSRSGNGPFGMGWGLNLHAIRLRTNKGVPAYDGTDEFTGPDGEVLVPVLTDGGTPETHTATTLLSTALGGSFTVHAYRSRTETVLSRMEHWVPEGSTGTDFWVLYTPDGQVHLLGRNQQARISNPANAAQVAAWLLESSVSLTGEQIYYQYRAEDENNCGEEEKKAHPGASAQRYLAATFWGNKKAGRTLPTLAGPFKNYEWLFVMTFDFGERQENDADIPSWQLPETGNWMCRKDSFSSWEYGFEVRTRRICHEVLLFHRLRTLDGGQEENETPELITRLLLKYGQTPSATTLKNAHQMAYEQPGRQSGLCRR